MKYLLPVISAICLYVYGCENLEIKRTNFLEVESITSVNGQFLVKSRFQEGPFNEVVQLGHTWGKSQSLELTNPDFTFYPYSGNSFESQLSRLDGNSTYYVSSYAIFADSTLLISEPQMFETPFESYLEFAFVEGGNFVMGNDVIGDDDERPAHMVCLDDFMIMTYQVTQAFWEEVMCDGLQNPSQNNTCKKCPVENITIEEVEKFIECLNNRTGEKFRLPTEAEWEYVAKGGKNQDNFIYSGSDTLDVVGWNETNTTTTQEVGLKRANSLNVYDMTGNVCEICSDWYDANYYSQLSISVPKNPKGPNQGNIRLCRGGTYNRNNFLSRNTERLVLASTNGNPLTRCFNCGIRLAKDIN